MLGLEAAPGVAVGGDEVVAVAGLRVFELEVHIFNEVEMAHSNPNP